MFLKRIMLTSIIDQKLFFTWTSFLARGITPILIYPALIIKFPSSLTAAWLTVTPINAFIVAFVSSFSNPFIRGIIASREGEYQGLSESELMVILGRLSNSLAIILPLVFVFLVQKNDINMIDNIWIFPFLGAIIFKVLNWRNTLELESLGYLAEVRKIDTIINTLLLFISYAILISFSSLLTFSISFNIFSIFLWLKNKNLLEKKRSKRLLSNGLNWKLSNKFLVILLKASLGVLLSGSLTTIFILPKINNLGPEIASGILLCLSLVRNSDAVSRAPFYSSIPDINELRLLNSLRVFRLALEKIFFGYSIYVLILLFLCLLYHYYYSIRLDILFLAIFISIERLFGYSVQIATMFDRHVSYLLLSVLILTLSLLNFSDYKVVLYTIESFFLLGIVLNIRLVWRSV